MRSNMYLMPVLKVVTEKKEMEKPDPGASWWQKLLFSLPFDLQQMEHP